MGLIDLISAIQSIQSIQEYFLNTLLLFNGWLSTITSWFVKILSLSVVARAYTSLPIIQETWRILRDFSNMLFIVALIVMAFGTVFNKENFSFNKLFPKFLIAAVFINFSLVIGGLVIDGFQVLTNVFLVSIGNLGDRLGQAFNLASLLPNAGQGVNVEEIAGNADLLGSAILSLIFLTVLSLFFLFAVAVSAVFSVARIPILWGLLILSPIAWMASIFPKTRNFFDNWWKWFIGWNMFLPIYLFFLSLGLLFLSRRNEIGTILPAGSGDQSLVEGIAGSLTFNLFFFYAFTVAILVFGLSWALKLSGQGGSWMTGTINWARGAAMRLPGLSQYDATRRAARKRFEQFRQEGFQGRLGRLPIIGYGGAEGLEAQRKSYERVFGVRGAEFAKSKDFAMRVKREQDIIREQYQLGALTPEEIVSRAKGFNANDPRGFAYRNVVAEIGRLDPELFSQTLQSLTGDPLAVRTFTETAKKAKFGGIVASELVQMAAAQGENGKYKFLAQNRNFLPIRRELFKHIQSDPAAPYSVGAKEFRTGFKILGGPNTADGSRFIKDIAKIKPNLEIEYIYSTPSKEEKDKYIANLREQIKDDREYEKTVREYEDSLTTSPGDLEELKTYRKRYSERTEGKRLPTAEDLYTDKLGSARDVANMPLKDVWQKIDFRNGLIKHISQITNDVARNRYLSKLSEAISEGFNTEEKMEILNTEIIPKLTPIKRVAGGKDRRDSFYEQYNDERDEEEAGAKEKTNENDKEEDNDTASGVMAKINPNNTLDLRTIQREDEEEDDII